MKVLMNFRQCASALAALLMVSALVPFNYARAETEAMAFKLALANAVSSDESLFDFYRQQQFRPIWIVGEAAKARRIALLTALEEAAGHGLPINRYELESLRSKFSDAETIKDLAAAESAASQSYLRFARDVHTGALDPEGIDEGIKRKRVHIETDFLMAGILSPNPESFLARLAPTDSAYLRLRKELLRLDKAISGGGWGSPIRSDIDVLKLGDRGRDVVALRNRLIRMGFLSRNASVEYDVHIEGGGGERN